MLSNLKTDYQGRYAIITPRAILTLLLAAVWCMPGMAEETGVSTGPAPFDTVLFADQDFQEPGFAAGQAGMDPYAADRPQCLVTNAFYDTYLREALNVIAAQCGVTIIADGSVMGIVTTEFLDVPLETVLERLVLPYGLTYRWMDGYYLVGAPHPDNPSFPLLTQTELYRPRYLKAQELSDLMSRFYEPFLSVNKETNTISLTGSPELIARMKTDLGAIDIPPRQVMIEALITETSSDVSRQLGISWGLGGSNSRDSIRIEAYPRTPPDSGYVPDVNHIGGFFQRVDIRSGEWFGQFRAELDALVEEGEARIRANPRIATLEGHQANIFIGREEYFSILTGSLAYAYARLEVISTGIVLTITPYVSDDNHITLEVEPQVSDVVGSGSTGLPVTNKRSVKTTVRVTNGETAVIGGLLVKNRIEVVRKIPLLGSIPILGHLFRHTDTQNVENEVSVLITPRLWSDTEEDPGFIHEPLMQDPEE